MEKIICTSCTANFNSTDHLPKILPCLGLKCLKCLKKELFMRKDFLMNCAHCSKSHFIQNVDDLPTSQIVLHLISGAQPESKILPLTSEETSSDPILKDFSAELSDTLSRDNFEIYKHYDNIINDIDIRAEQFIQFIHLSRRDLQDKVKALRDETLTLFSATASPAKETNPHTKDMLAIKEKLLNLDDDTQVKNPPELSQLVAESNKLQRHIYDMKKKLWYFSENTIKLENSLLGQTLNSTFDQNYLKIRKLEDILADKNTLAHKVTLSDSYTQSVLRHEVLALNRIVKVYFTTFRVLMFETFDLQGKLLKSIKAFEGKICSLKNNHTEFNFFTNRLLQFEK